MLMGRYGILRDKEDNLVKDLKETTLSFEKLGKKYGVSRQAVHGFCKMQGIMRPVRPKRQHKARCPFCQKLIQISKKPHSEFISIHTIAKKTGGSVGKCLYHLRTLRDKGLVGQRFGRLVSKRLEKAYEIYFTKRLPIRKIGQKIGVRIFQWFIRRHRALGWNVPPSLYNGREKSRIQSETYRKKRKRLMDSGRSP
jgi:biotin operon repressor